MKKRSGFTLVELSIGMAVFVIIVGAIFGIFAIGMRSFTVGHDQATAYAEARDVMNDLKTTLRYAQKDGTGIKFDKLRHELVYSGVMITRRDSENPITVAFEREISWVDDTHRQLKIIKKEYGKEDSEVIFPKNLKNSAFDTSEYLKVYADIYGSAVSAGTFPIFENKTGENIYNIVLPVKYPFLGGNKVEVLRTRVNVKPEIKEINSEAASDVLAKGLGQFFAENPYALGSGSNIFTQLDSSAVNTELGNLAGATKRLVDYMKSPKSGMAGDYEAMGLDILCWAITPIDAAHKSTNTPKDVAGWYLYVTKNVVDDFDSINGAPNNGTLFKEQAMAGNLIIRKDWGMLVYKIEYDKDGNKIGGSNLGVAKCKQNGNYYQINTGTFKTMAEYTALGVGDKRIDYTGNGREYTKALAENSYHATYEYPPPNSI